MALFKTANDNRFDLSKLSGGVQTPDSRPSFYCSQRKPDGIRYPTQHDPTRVALAIFTRPRSTFHVTSLGSLIAPSNMTLLNQLLRDYNVDLI